MVKSVVNKSIMQKADSTPDVKQSAVQRRNQPKIIRKRFKFGEVQKLKDISESHGRVQLIPTDVPITGYVNTEQLTLGTINIAEFCVGHLQNYFEASRIVNDCYENFFVGSNRSVPPVVKQKSMKRIGSALEKLEKLLSEIEKNVDSFFRKNPSLKKLKVPASYPLEVNYSYLADKRFNLAIQKADELLFNLNHLYRNGGFGLDLLKADDKFKKIRRDILNGLNEVCKEGWSARKEILESKRSARETAQKKREEAEKKQAELAAKKAEEAKERVERMKAAKGEEAKAQDDRSQAEASEQVAQNKTVAQEAPVVATAAAEDVSLDEVKVQQEAKEGAAPLVAPATETVTPAGDTAVV